MMLLDTSGLLALLDAREPQHPKARHEYAHAASRVTHAFVLAELVALSNARGVPSSLSLQFVMSLVANPDI
jgi:predicted nucleic acid-binding protein